MEGLARAVLRQHLWSTPPAAAPVVRVVPARVVPAEPGLAGLVPAGLVVAVAPRRSKRVVQAEPVVPEPVVVQAEPVRVVPVELVVAQAVRVVVQAAVEAVPVGQGCR